MIKYILFFVLLCTQTLLADIDWPYVVKDFQEHPDAYQYTFIDGGASNVNYRLTLDGDDYCFRMAPKTGKAIYADLEIEYQVLQLLSTLEVSAQPLFFDREQRVLVTKFIPHSDAPVNLLDPATQESVCAMLHKIEEANLAIPRVFKPFQDVITLVAKAQSFGAPDFSEEFYEVLFPSLAEMDYALSKNPRRSLCHLDLHSKNILQDDSRLWFIDWEYAVMSHPYLVLASMASIERWSDEQMWDLLNEYVKEPQAEDFYTLYLYRIVADIFWTGWNHIQAHTSPIKRPYPEWEKLFQEAALRRVLSPQFRAAILYLNK